jgi:hypothetical protein
MKKRQRWAWFIPSFNGDIRLEPAKDDPEKTTLTIFEPTDSEKKSVAELSGILLDRKWIETPISIDDQFDFATLGEPESDPFRAAATKTWTVAINAPLEEVGPVFVAALKPGPAVLTAVKFANGQIETVEHQATGETTTEKLKKLAKKTGAKAAATITRATPCCPSCIQGSISPPAVEVLLSFLTPEQHKTWAKDRYIIVRGGLSGHRYIIAHRNSEIAAKNGRICYDADDRNVMHFHQSDVPPEEEVLGAMLVLQHAEHWLRNEATCVFGEFPFSRVFKNPFGDYMDGVMDASLTSAVGAYAIMKGAGAAD